MAGRPREFDLEAALVRSRDLFWEHGYEGVSMSDLVQALGIASARIYAAFGSKEELFRKTILHYEHGEGGFADEALNSPLPVFEAIEQMLVRAVDLYTKRRKGKPLGCMVVSSAVNCAPENKMIGKWLQEHRCQRTDSIIQRFEKAAQQGELPAKANPRVLGELCATVLHGISVQARDGEPRERLLSSVHILMATLEHCADR